MCEQNNRITYWLMAPSMYFSKRLEGNAHFPFENYFEIDFDEFFVLISWIRVQLLICIRSKDLISTIWGRKKKQTHNIIRLKAKQLLRHIYMCWVAPDMAYYSIFKVCFLSLFDICLFPPPKSLIPLWLGILLVAKVFFKWN